MRHEDAWRPAKLGEIGKWGSGGTPKSNETAFYGGDVPWIRSGDLPDGVITSHPLTITKLGFKSCSAKWVPENAVLIALYGATIGKLGITKYPVTTNQAVAFCIPNPELLSTQFLYFYLLSCRSELVAKGQGGAQPNISQTILKQHPILLPPSCEQKLIVEKLSTLQQRAECAAKELGRIPSLIDRYKQAVLASALRGDLTAEWRRKNPICLWSTNERLAIEKRRREYVVARRGSRLRDIAALTPPGDRVDLPSSWMSGCLADLCDLRTGFAFKSSWFSSKGRKLLRGANVSPGAIDWGDSKFLAIKHVADFESEYSLAAGDIVVAMDRPLIAGGLKIARVAAEDAGALLVQRVASPVPSPMASPAYVWWLLNSAHFIGHIEHHATGSDLPHISGNDILSTPTPMPPLAEQVEIVRLVDEAMQSIGRMGTESRKATQLLNRLGEAALSKVFRGELREY